jgi:cell division septation protein DedD
VQLGAFRSLEEASAFVTAHAAALEEVPLHVVTAEIPGRGTWYRVRAGAAKTREDADQLRRSLPAEIGRDALIVPYR